MNVSVVQSSLNPLEGLRSPLIDSKQESIQEQAAAPQAAVQVESQPSTASNNPSNFMSQNFVSAERQESRYVQANLIARRAEQSVQTSKHASALNAILVAAKTEYESAQTSGERYIALKRAEKNISYYESGEVTRNAEETHLKETREDLERKAEEAMAPKDADGNPIETPGSGDAPSAEVNTPQETAPAPDSPVADTPAPAPTPDSPVMEAPAADAPQISVKGSAGPASSVDLIV